MRYPCGMPPVMTLRDSRARAEKAFQLRAVGRSWREVATTLNYRSIGAAQSAVKRHEERVGPEPVEASRRSLIEGVRVTNAILFDRFAAAASRKDDRVLALLNGELCRNRDQLAKLTGAYAAEKSEVDVTVHRPPGEILADFKRELLASFVDAEVVETREIQK